MNFQNINWQNIDKWFLLILKERYGVDFIIERTPNRVKISLPNMENSIVINKIDIAFYNYANALNIGCTKWSASSNGFTGIIDDELYLPYGNELTDVLIKEEFGNYIFNYDFLGLVYWILNRLEEVNSIYVDRFDRFDPKFSHAYVHGYLQRPIVDEWFDIFKQVMLRLWSTIQLQETKFRFEISHDVDRPTRYGFKNGINLIKAVLSDIKNGYISDAIIAPLVKLNSHNNLHAKDPYNTFEWILNISKKLNIKNAFYFIADGKHANDADYKLSYTSIQNLLKKIAEHGHEIGLHPSFDTYLNPEQLQKELLLLKDVCNKLGIHQNTWGGRMHYLRWSHPNTLQSWNDVGLSYDSTLGYSAETGFRCGTCHEYTMFNPVTYELLKLKQKPLIFMEVMCVQDTQLNLDTKNEIQNHIYELIEIVKKLNGNFTFLWHNSNLRNPLSRQLYEDTLEFLVSKT